MACSTFNSELEVCMGMGVPMGFPREWKWNLNKDGNKHGNTTTRELERLMLVGSQNHSGRLGKSHYTTSCVLCLRLPQKRPQSDLFLSCVTQWQIVLQIIYVSWICVAKTTLLCLMKDSAVTVSINCSTWVRLVTSSAFTISEVAADWQEPMVPQRIMWPSSTCANGQLDPWCS